MEPLDKEHIMAKKHHGEDNITDILDMPSSSIERPKPIPQGTYVSQVMGQFREDKSTKKQTRYHEYTLKLVKPATNGQDEPLDVDMEDLARALTKASGEIAELSARTLRHTLYITPDALWRYKEFLDHLGIPQEEDGEELTTLQRAGMAPGRFVLVHIKHAPSQDGLSVFANIDKTAPYEEE